MTILLLFLGALLIILGGLMLIVATFRVSIWWGLFCLLFIPLQIVFVARYWDESRSSIVTQIAGLVLIFVAGLVGGDEFWEEYKTQFNQYMQQVAPEQMQQLNELQSMVAEPTMMSVPAATVETNEADVVSSDKAVVDSDKKESSPAVPALVGEQKVIHKCVDAKGKVAYTEQPCSGAQEKAITIKSIEEPPGVAGGNVLDKVKKIVEPDPEPAR